MQRTNGIIALPPRSHAGRSRNAAGRRAMIYPFFRPLLFTLDPETAHDMAFASLDVAARFGIARVLARRVPPSPVTAMGLRFPNRIGLAAGLDKNAAHTDG